MKRIHGPEFVQLLTVSDCISESTHLVNEPVLRGHAGVAACLNPKRAPRRRLAIGSERASTLKNSKITGPLECGHLRYAFLRDVSPDIHRPTESLDGRLSMYKGAH